MIRLILSVSFLYLISLLITVLLLQHDYFLTPNGNPDLWIDFPIGMYIKLSLVVYLLNILYIILIRNIYKELDRFMG